VDIVKDIKGFLSGLTDIVTGLFLNLRLRRIKKIVLFTIPFLLGIILLLGWMSAKKVREVVINDFNQQQLVLARHAASQIENSLNTLKRELLLLSLSPSIQYFEKVFMDKRMAIAFSSIKEEGAIEVKYIERSGKNVYLVNRRGYQTMQPYPDDMDYLNWAKDANNKGNILITGLSYGLQEGAPSHITKMVIPVWQVSVDEKHPVATNLFSGVLMFNIETTTLIKKTVRNIRSGKTGYAWVIDNKGIFLYHPEEEFIGDNAFEARKRKNPTISFDRINEIQKEMMLKGKEGTSWYISGWHKGVEGEMKKLIAYVPIHLSDNLIWSVAVVAPLSEVEGTIHDVQIRQFILEGVVILSILFGGLLIINMMSKWSSSLSMEVEKRTLELRKSENQYRLLIENANDIIFTVDRNGIITSINKSGLSFFGKKIEEVIGQNIGELCVNEGSAALQLKAVDEVFSKKESKKVTYPINIGDNEYWVSTNFSVLVDAKGNPYAVLGISRDITADRKRTMEEQMYHTEKLASIGTLAAGVAHEVNNPLALILGFSDILIEKAKPDSNEYDILKTIERHALHAKKIVENLLSFARYTEHKEEFIDVNSNIETILEVVENTLKLNNISLNRQLQNNLSKVKADAGEIQQVFLNIINNAIHAMKGGGSLTVTTELEDNKVKIKFTDTGHGIKKEHRTKIFDPLFTTKKIGEGTGLGLSVSYGIITKHGGTITFETKTKDESEETGTTFIITLPAIKNVEG
jgi:PAS domain S-box-containing protein